VEEEVFLVVVEEGEEVLEEEWGRINSINLKLNCIYFCPKKWEKLNMIQTLQSEIPIELNETYTFCLHLTCTIMDLGSKY
jgi:hypothetical protein